MKTWLMLAAAEIPGLLPMREEIPLTFVEKHGWWPVLGVAAGVLVGAFIALRLLRRRQVVEILPPEVLARRALEALRGRAEDTALLQEVSGIVRRYLLEVFIPAQDELTTDELVGMLTHEARVKAETRTALAEFLKYCDLQKFAPAPAAIAPGLVEQALELMRCFEADLRASSPATRACRA